MKDFILLAAMNLITMTYNIYDNDEHVKDESSQLRMVCLLSLCNCDDSQSIKADIINTSIQLQLNTYLATNIPALPSISKASLFRAILIVYDVKLFVCFPNLYTSESYVNLTNLFGLLKSGQSFTKFIDNYDYSNRDLNKYGLLIGSVSDIILSICNSANPLFQLIGLQILQIWFNKVEEFLQLDLKINDDSFQNLIIYHLEIFLKITNLLNNCWNHPSKKINHLIPTLYQKLVNLLGVIDKYRNTKGTLDEQPMNDIWAEFISKALSLPAQHRGRYQALNMLLPKIRAKRFLRIQPNVIEELLNSSMGIRDIASAVSHFLGTLVHNLVESIETSKPVYSNRHGAISKKNKVKILSEDDNLPKIEIRQIWGESKLIFYFIIVIIIIYNYYLGSNVAKCLCSSDAKKRINCADYLINAFLEFDPHSALHLINMIRNFSEAEVTIERKLWGIVNIVLQSRLISPDLPASEILFEKIKGCTNVLAKEGHLMDWEVYMACMSKNDELRLTAFSE